MVFESKRSDDDIPFSAAHLLASAHSTSLSSSRSDLFPTNTTTKWGLANVLASASHLERFVKDSRLKIPVRNSKSLREYHTYFVIS